jgi:O-antigen/teichoic acid export membrane protein
MIIVVGGRTIVALAGLATVAVLTRQLGPEGFGNYRIALIYVSFVAIPAELGLYTIVLREISRPGADTPHILGAALSLRLIASAAVLLLGSLAAVLLPYPTVVIQGICIAALYYVTVQGGIFLGAVFQKHLKQIFQMAAEIAGVLVVLALIGVGVLLDAGFLVMLGATAGGGLVAFVCAALLARRLEPFKLGVDLKLWRELIVEGLPVGGSRVAIMAIMRGDILLLSLLDTSEAVGLYGVPSRIFEVVTGITIMFAAMTMPALMVAASTADGGAFSRHLRDGVMPIAVLSGGFIALCFAFAEQILAVIAGSDFAPAAPALILLAFAAGAHAIGELFRLALIAMHLQHRVLAVDVVALIGAIAAYLLLIPRFSYLGAAIATALVELALCLAMAAVLARTYAGRPSTGGIAKVFLAAAISLVLMRSMSEAALPWPVAMVSGGAAYVAVLLLVGAVPPSYLRDLLRRGG